MSEPLPTESFQPPDRGGSAARHQAASPEPPRSFGKYRIRARLGAGAFGAVYLAEDETLQREVALKIPSRRAMANDWSQDRFLREARAAAALEHPNICPIFEVGQVGDTPFLAMAFCRGGTLRQIMTRHSRFSERQILALVRKLALALDHAHQAGIIHRDLKPENILINDRGEPVITDFGLAKRIRQTDPSLTQTGHVVGTPAYMAPEQARGERQSPASDIFSLGIIFYELLCGRRPYEGDANAVMLKIASHQHEPLHPSASRGDLSTETAEICLRCLSKDPARRFGSMRELADALRNRAAAISTKETGPDRTADTERVLDKLAATLAQSESRAGERVVPLAMWIAGSALTAAILFIGMFLLFRSESGKVRFHFNLDTSDPGVVVKIDGAEIDKESLSDGIELPPGPHELVVYRDGAEVRRYAFTVQRGMTTVERIEGLEAARPPPGDRDLIARLLRAGAQITVMDGRGNEQVVRPGASLPPGELFVHGVHFPEPVTVDDAALQGLADAGQLTRLDIDNAAALTPTGLAALGDFPALNHVRLVNLRCDPASIGSWKNLPALRHLDLSRCRRLAGLVAKLGNLPALEALILHDTELAVEDGAAIGRFQSLEQLNLDRVPLESMPVESWNRLSALQEVSLAGTGLTLARLPTWGPRLQRMDISSTPTSDGDADWLRNHRGLQRVNLSSTGVTGDVLEMLWELPELRELEMASTLLADRDLALSDRSGAVVRWDVRGTFVTAEEVAAFQSRHPDCELLWEASAARDLASEVQHAVGGVGGRVDRSEEEEEAVPGGSLRDGGRAETIRVVDLSNATPEALELLPLIGRLPELTDLELGGLPVHDGDLRHLRKLEQLRRLGLSRTGITDSGLERLSLLRSLQSLDLTGTSVRGQGLDALAELSLQSLRMGRAPEGEMRLTAIGQFPQLVQLDITDIPLSELLGQVPELPGSLRHLGSSAARDEDLREWVPPEGLQSLDLSGSPVTDDVLERLARMPRVRHIALSHTGVTGASLRALTGRPLTSLRLAGLPLVPQAILELSRIRGLETLDVAGTPVDNVSLTALARNSSLRVLDVTSAWTTRRGRDQFRAERPDCELLPGDPPADPNDARELLAWIQQQGGDATLLYPDGRRQRVGHRDAAPAGQFAIAEVSLLRSPRGIDDDGFRKLSGTRGLRVLAVFGPEATDAAVAQLQELPGLESLTLDHVGVTDRGFRYLLACPGLKVLRLNAARLTPASFPVLARLKSLESLQISRSGWDAEILDALVQLPELRKLDIDFPLGQHARKLQQLPALSHLVFTRCGQLSDADLAVLANLDKVRELTIRQSRLDPRARRRLGALQRVASLELEDVELEPQEFRYLAGLRQMRQLRLTDMKLSPQALASLATMQQLLNLTLQRCQISEDEGAALRRALPRCDVRIRGD